MNLQTLTYLVVGRVDKQDTMAGMLGRLVFTLGYIVYFKGLLTEPFALNASENWLFDISAEDIGGLGAVLKRVIAAAVSTMTPPPPLEVRHLVERIRVPS